MQLTTIPACLRGAAAERPDLEAVVDGDLRMTFADLDRAVTAFARAAIANGLQPGDRASVWAPNGARWVIAALGIQAAGGILVPINTRFKGQEARYAIDKVRASLLVLTDSFLGNGYLAMLRGADPASPSGDRPIPASPSVRTVVATDDISDDAVLGWEGFIATGETVPESAVDQRIAAQTPSDVSDILFTSGTTGYPKGAMVSHQANLRVDEAWSDMVGLRGGDRYLLVNPFFHSFGYRAGLIACLVRRATMIPLPVFDVPTVLATVEKERVTVFPGAPTVYTSILDHSDFGRHDLSSVRLAVTGSTIVPVPLLRRMRSELGFSTVITAYGMTECCGTATVCPPDTDEERLSTSCGIAIPGTEVRIADPAGNELPAREQGEVQVRGYNVMTGYFEDPAATDAAIDADGWLHTGDVGWKDEDGYLRITDRIKDMFVVGGFNVYPAEVERLISEHGGVSDVAVIGMPDARMGEVGHAYVVLRPGESADEADLIGFCRTRMANYKVPRRITIVDVLPRTPSGKVQKFRLRDDAAVS